MAAQLYRRPEKLNLDVVGRQSIMVVGVGSLGSMALRLLAYPWKKIVLVDPDKLEVENVERHHLGYEHVGQYKATAMRRWLTKSRHIDGKTIVTHRLPVERVIDRHPDISLIIETTGIPTVRRNVNAWCYQNNIPALYGGIYPLGIGGDVIVIPDPKQVCYQCYDASVMGNDQPLENYGLSPDQLDAETGELQEMPYLSSPVAATAADMADLAISLLMGEPMRAMQMIHCHDHVAVQHYPAGLHHNVVKQWIENQLLLGIQPNMRLVDEAGGFTLQLSRGKLCLSIQASSGCPFHYSSPSSAFDHADEW